MSDSAVQLNTLQLILFESPDKANAVMSSF